MGTVTTIRAHADAAERRAYERALVKAKGNRTVAAQILGVGLATVKRRLGEWTDLAERFPAVRGNPNNAKLRANSQSEKK